MGKTIKDQVQEYKEFILQTFDLNHDFIFPNDIVIDKWLNFLKELNGTCGMNLFKETMLNISNYLKSPEYYTSLGFFITSHLLHYSFLINCHIEYLTPSLQNFICNTLLDIITYKLRTDLVLDYRNINIMYDTYYQKFRVELK